MSTSDRTLPDGDDFPVTGAGGEAPSFLINDQLPEISPETDGLLADIYVLMAQNPGNFNFRAIELREMNEKAKRQLLIDMQEALGIKPLKRLTP